MGNGKPFEGNGETALGFLPVIGTAVRNLRPMRIPRNGEASMDTWTSKVCSMRPIRHSVALAPLLNPGVPNPMQTETPRRRWIASEDAQQLWHEYNRTRDSRLRDRLIMTYAPLVKYIAYRKVRELPASCQVEDFISCGLEALITAIDRYDPEKGATLEQFAWTRIHGAILDELRRQDWAPRSVRRWERDIETAREEFTGNHGRRPTQEELATALAVSPQELRTRQDEISVSEVTSLNTIVTGDEDGTTERIDTLRSHDR